jgi:outer membrane protein, heavy metal efflux system
MRLAMNRRNRCHGVRRGRQLAAPAALVLLLAGSAAALAQPPRPPQEQVPAPPATPPATAPPGQSTAASPAAHITLDRAIELALQHNHTLLAARTTIDQNRAQEITANLRPNPEINSDAEFLPIFQPSAFSLNYLANLAEFDLGISYLIERGGKRHERLKAAQDQTAVTVATVDDNERNLKFNVAQQFIAALEAKANLELAQADLASFQNSIQISRDQYRAGAIGEGDLLKLQLQMLQFQQDSSAAQLAQVQALASLRQFVGFDGIPENYAVDGELTYQPVRLSEDDLKMMALRDRPDYHEAVLNVTAAQSQYTLARGGAKQDVSVGFNYSHLGNLNTGSFFGSIGLPIFNRNQGEIARTQYAVTQARETQSATSEGVLSDVINAYESLRTNDEIVKLFAGGYLKQSTDSRDISQYAYMRGAASLLDFLDAERSYRATQLAYNQALAAYMLSLEQLRQAVGTRSVP